MGFFDDVADVATALGNGVYSVGEDIFYGAERTVEGIGLAGFDRSAEIGIENEYLARNLTALAKYGLQGPNSPLREIIVKILERYYGSFPEVAIRKLAKAAGIGGAYVAGRLVLGKKLATTIAVKVAKRIAATTAYKQLAKKLGVSGAAGATGVGAVVSLAMLQGVAQRASKASKRLKSKHPALWKDLRRQKGLDMLFFLVEKPLAKYLNAIEAAHKNSPLFQREVTKMYQTSHDR